MVYAGGYDSVQRHVRQWRPAQPKLPGEVFIPLWFAPGEAYQFDWSHEIVVLGGVTTTAKVAHVRLCHSRMFLLRVYPRETQEMVFDAHDHAFRLFGGAVTVACQAPADLGERRRQRPVLERRAEHREIVLGIVDRLAPPEAISTPASQAAGVKTGGRDCAPVPVGAVWALLDGTFQMLVGGAPIPLGNVLFNINSPDDRMHACVVGDEVRCLFLPAVL
jgi:hypothetical protein